MGDQQWASCPLPGLLQVHLLLGIEWTILYALLSLSGSDKNLTCSGQSRHCGNQTPDKKKPRSQSCSVLAGHSSIGRGGENGP